jgi:hypothetical protein
MVNVLNCAPRWGYLVLAVLVHTADFTENSNDYHFLWYPEPPKADPGARLECGRASVRAPVRSTQRLRNWYLMLHL